MAFKDEVLSIHNKYRSEVSTTPALTPLQWLDSLEVSASKWAKHLFSKQKLEHSQPGENLWMGTPNAYTVQQMVDAWGSEKKLFKNGKFPDVSVTGNWMEVGHYSQMIWRKTTHLGCHLEGGNVLVCHYSPFGNMKGENVY